jgi:hypothetical protein
MIYLWATLGALVCLTAIFALLMTSIQYRITSKYLVVYCLGLPVRRLALKDMISVSKRRRFRAELWVSTFRFKHRKLVIRRDRGLFREIVITPAYRYAFRNQLETAVETASGHHIEVEETED